jgi:hypothetical protein
MISAIPGFDRDHPFVPTCPPGRAPRAVEVTPKGAKRSGAPRAGAVDGTSTALPSEARATTRRRAARLPPRKVLD